MNIAKILKDKPQGTKLYDLLRNIEVELDSISFTDYESVIWCSYNDVDPYDLYGYSTFGTERGWLDGLQILLPSKDMCDWQKFAWKEGDALVNSSGFKLFFDRWANDNYTKFFGKVNLLEEPFSYETEKYTLISKEETLDTLEIEKPEFKDGDILCVIDSSDNYHYILIYKGQDNDHIYRYITMFEDNYLYMKKDGHLTKPKDYSMRYATEEEKQQLFDALAKENKVWDAEKKQIVNLKPKWTPKPFDRVITRNATDDVWTANIFSHMDSHGEYVTIACVGGYTHCLPYNEETAKLIGTTNNAK